MARILKLEKRAPQVSEKIRLNPDALGSDFAKMSIAQDLRERKKEEKRRRLVTQESRWEQYRSAVGRTPSASGD